MPQIIPIKELKDTSAISERCHSAGEPIFVTKNGYGDMVIMSMETYEEALFMADVRRKLQEAEAQVKAGRTVDAGLAVAELKTKYGL